MTTVATLPITTARLLSRHEIAEGTMAFRFERPTNWAFKAGQYLDMTLLDPPETDLIDSAVGRLEERDGADLE